VGLRRRGAGEPPHSEGLWLHLDLEW
jgi:hypothetical protein